MTYHHINLGQRLDNGVGYCLDVYGGLKNDNVPAISYPCHNGPNQQFRYNKKYQTIQALHSKKCLYLMNNNRLVQKTCSTIKKQIKSRKQKRGVKNAKTRRRTYKR